MQVCLFQGDLSVFYNFLEVQSNLLDTYKSKNTRIQRHENLYLVLNRQLAIYESLVFHNVHIHIVLIHIFEGRLLHLKSLHLIWLVLMSLFLTEQNF